MTANGWVKFDVAENKCLVGYYAMSGEWFVMIRRTFVFPYPSVSQ